MLTLYITCTSMDLFFDGFPTQPRAKRDAVRTVIESDRVLTGNIMSDEATAGLGGALLLIGDLGGTNVRFSLHPLQSNASSPTADTGTGEEASGSQLTAPIFETRFYVGDFQSLEEVVTACLDLIEKKVNKTVASGEDSTSTTQAATTSRQDIVGLCMSVCGPVKSDGTAILLAPVFGKQGWAISERKLEQHTHLKKVLFLNDFHAVGLAIPSVQEDDKVCLYNGDNRCDLSELLLCGCHSHCGVRVCVCAGVLLLLISLLVQWSNQQWKLRSPRSRLGIRRMLWHPT